MADAQKIITYTESPDVIANPERGLFLYGGESIDHSSRCWRSDQRFKDFVSSLEEAAKKQVTLVYLQYDLGAFRQTDQLNDSVYQCLQNDFDEVNKHGFKVILRFAYNPRKDGDDFDGSSNVANPYEADIERILKHLNDKKFIELIQKNSHLIAVWQAGFLGKYGEWYYTANDAGVQEMPNMAQRVKVLKRMLEILPKPGIVQVRTPYYKAYAIKALTGQPDVAADIAERVGIYHDSFLQNDETESGTFSSYSNAPETVADWKSYFLAQSLRLPIGGETSDKPRPERANTEQDKLRILNGFAAYHWSFFNQAKALAEIKNNGKFVMDWSPLLSDSSRRLEKWLGYRLVLKQGKFNDRIKSGDKLKVDLTLANVGWASPFKRRKVEMFLCAKNSQPCSVNNNGFVSLDNVDVRDWLPGKDLPLSVEIPTAGLPKGVYYIVLNLRDYSEQLKKSAAYSIHLANNKDGKDEAGKTISDVFRWDATNGYNQFGTITIE